MPFFGVFFRTMLEPLSIGPANFMSRREMLSASWQRSERIVPAPFNLFVLSGGKLCLKKKPLKSIGWGNLRLPRACVHCAVILLHGVGRVTPGSLVWRERR